MTWAGRAQLAWVARLRVPGAGGLQLDLAAQNERAVAVPGSHLGQCLRRSAYFAGVAGAGAARDVPNRWHTAG